jgi:hypothetical protein
MDDPDVEALRSMTRKLVLDSEDRATLARVASRLQAAVNLLERPWVTTLPVGDGS